MQGKELTPLTGLRGVLAIWVVLIHAGLGMEVLGFSFDLRLGKPVANLIFSGTLAVDAFFILSGFILSHVYIPRFAAEGLGYTPQFLALRLARIYPVHALVLAAYLVIYWTGIPWPAEHCGNPINTDPATCNRFGAPEFLKSALLVTAWSNDVHLGWNMPAWSISAEWFVYLLFPALLVLRARASPSQALFLSVIAIAFMTALVLMYSKMFRGVSDDYGLLRVVPEFIAGMCLHRVTQAAWFERAPWPAIAIAAVVTALALIVSGVFPVLAVFPIAALILALASPKQGLVSKALSRPTMLWLGGISYALYMVNMIVLEGLGLAKARLTTGDIITYDWLGYVALAVSTAVCVLVAWAVTRWVEVPARNALKTRSINPSSAVA